MSRRIEARLTLAALDAAIALRSPPPGCVHHTDRGSRAISTGRRNASWMEDAMARRKRGADWRLRAPLRSPRRPGVAKREDRRRFWLDIAGGRPSGDAAQPAGVSPAVGTRGGVGPGGGGGG